MVKQAVFVIPCCILICISCTAHGNQTLQLTAEALLLNPLPQPEFIVDMPSYPPFECVRINQEPIWELGDYASELSIHLANTMEIVVNDTHLPSSAINATRSLAAFPMYDDEDGIIGFYGGTISACFSVSNLAPGAHIATIKLFSLSGIEYSYTWAFRIEP